MERVDRYKAVDGEEFKTEAECLNHETIVNLKQIYEEEKLYGLFEGCRIEADDFFEWVEANLDLVKKIIDAIEYKKAHNRFSG